MKLSGIHHITLICSDMERTVKFYTEVLGLVLVKRTVNFDDPSAKHFYFGDERGSPGSLVTFFEYPGGAPGRLGIGVTHHLAFIVEDEEEQRRWRERLVTHGVQVTAMIDRRYFKSIYFRDPDGGIL
ncbi:MAG: VOC family protein [Chloroflexi bacterium]|nr:VOC family protein [Chloroflexota bacterium]